MRRWACFSLLALSLSAQAASPAKDLEGVAVRIGSVEASLRALDEDFSARRGLMGSGEARMRYTEAVYYYLVEDFGKAARSFFTLVESGALTESTLLADSEWFLGESLFELGSFTLAEEAYQNIIDQGFEHPLFADAVRRQLEVYGITGQADRFYSLYNSYVVTNRVQPNDLIVYTLAKSFYRQGDLLRAKSLFTDIQPDSPLYAKARYFLGTVRVVEKSFDSAIEEFLKVTEISAEDDKLAEVIELAHLALGRLYFETGVLDESSFHYQRISRDSKYFSEALYEMVWTFIKNEEYNEALRAVEIFLLAFPEHRFTAELKLLQGNLHMKLTNYREALDTYEGVVEEYSPIQIRLREIAGDSIDTSEWFDTLAALDESTGFETAGLPAFAVGMLVNQQQFSRARDTVLDLQSQEEQISESEQIIAEIESALGGEVETLGSFKRAREQLAQVHSEVLRLQIELLEVKGRYLSDELSGSAVSALRPLLERRNKVSEAERRISEVSNESADKLQVYDEQVRAVQSRAYRSYQEALSLRDEADALLEMLDSGSSPLWSEHVPRIRAKIENERAAIEREITALQGLQGDVARRTIMAPVERSSGQVDTRRARELLADEVANLSGDFASLQRQLGDNTFFTNWGSAWQRLEGISSSADRVGLSMSELEATEITSVRRRLDAERLSVQASRSEVDGLNSEAVDLSSEVTRQGFANLQDVFGDQIMRADMGIVDVYWNEKNVVSDEIKELQATQKAREEALRARFDRLEQALGD